MKQEKFSKAEMLHHFELIMPKNSKGKGLYEIRDGKVYKKVTIWKEL